MVIMTQIPREDLITRASRFEYNGQGCPIIYINPDSSGHNGDHHTVCVTYRIHQGKDFTVFLDTYFFVYDDEIDCPEGYETVPYLYELFAMRDEKELDGQDFREKPTDKEISEFIRGLGE